MTGVDSSPVRGPEPIAIIGMRGRFPGAPDLETLWRNLADGVESIATLSRDDMRAAGVPDHVSRLPGYVNAAPVLDAIDEFDAEFFGFSARDAALTDPQHRLFLETCWEALEDAGYDPARYPGSIGLFGGCEMSTYLYQLSRNAEALQYLDGMQLMVTNDKDHLCTQASYRLNLRGPSIVVQTTCSTSLVAVSLACESLHAGRCDMAMAGGVTVRVPQRGGYLYTPGSILSPDGHCRPFDANAQGTIVGSGVGLVVLKRLRDAVADGDNVRAVILGVGLNNDGNDKVGYTAPSFRGQAAAIKAAHRMAGVSPETIGYVEAHGTGTILGDPIEVSALIDAFSEGTSRRGFCGLGSAKSNFGHLSCAAGVAGLIKTVLVLEHGAIPPTVHYQSPNPAIDFVASPFFLTNRLHPWERNGVPRRAGVSSFGVGGTNAHVVVEEAPPVAIRPGRRSHQLLAVSARTPAALDKAAARLASHLERHPELDLADVAHTLHVGRHAFAHRRTLVVSSDDRGAAVSGLQAGGTVAAADCRPVFLFPGQGAQYPGMAEALYRAEPVVRTAIDRCAGALKGDLGLDLRRLLFPAESDRAAAAEELRDTRWAQPALFTVGYALAELWRSWGVTPMSMIGHSVGEFVAAVVAGVLSLDDALALIARRGQLIGSLPRGSMLAVMAPRELVESFVGGDVALAAVNAPGFAVLAGPDAAIEGVAAALKAESVATRRLHTSHAFHSSMMDPILAEFEDLAAGMTFSPPSIPFVATLTGTWANGDVTRPDYWSAQIRSTVRFADAVRTVVDAPGGARPAFLEVGPGNTLATFVREISREAGMSPPCLTSLPGAHESRSEVEAVLGSLGQLWANGVSVDWEAYHRDEPRTRVSLPTYPFERRSYWIGAKAVPVAERPERDARDTSDWFHRPVWTPIDPARDGGPTFDGRVLVFDEASGLGEAVAARVRAAGGAAVLVRRGPGFRRVDDQNYVLDPADPDGFRQLAAMVCTTTPLLSGVIDCWSATSPGTTDIDDAALIGLLAPLRLTHALSHHPTVRPLPLLLVTRGACRVVAGDVVDPLRALGAGAARVLPQEHPGVRAVHVDVDDDPTVPGLLLDELRDGAVEPTVAVRRGARHAESYEPVPLSDAPPPRGLPDEPVVMVTGGLGHMGLILAEGLFRQLDARIVLVGRTVLPEPAKWASRSADPATSEALRSTLERLAEMHEERPDVLVLNADLNDGRAVHAAVDAALARFGRIDLVVHGAARIDAGAFASAAETGPEVVEAQLSPKLRGLYNLIDAFRGREPLRWVLHSSISTVLGGLGLAAYSAVNAVLDAIAIAGGPHWLSIDWDLWENAAEAQIAGMPTPIGSAEGVEALHRLLGNDVGERVLVAVGDFAGRLKAWVRHADQGADPAAGAERHPRPNLPTPLVAPRTRTEQDLADIWGAQLGIDQVGVNDRFFDLGGHSLLAVQVAAAIRDRFQVEIPVLKLFQAPTVAEVALLIDASRSGAADGLPAGLPVPESPPEAAPIEGEAPEVAAKRSYREFYDDVTKRLAQSGVSDASFFLNYGYRSVGTTDEACFEVPERVFNANSVRLAYELLGATDCGRRRVLDVGCGRGGVAALIADRFDARVTGVDLSPEAIAFCRRVHRDPRIDFQVGDAEKLPCESGAFNVVTNVESSHTYPSLRAFFAEVARVLSADGVFLYTDLLPVGRWFEVRALLAPLGLVVRDDREITPNVLASCDEVAATRAQAFGGSNAAIDNFLAVPGSLVYEQMRSGAWQYRILRAIRS